MAKIIKNNLGNFCIICLIFLMMTVWIFAGKPQIWKKPAFPPKIQEVWADSIEITSTGTWDAPNGVTSVQVECWGGGGAGGGSSNTTISSGGGGGGEYSICANITVTSGQPGYDVTIGAGGTPGAGVTGGNGGNSSFVGNESVTCSAYGGVGGGGGTSTTAGTGGTGGTGDTTRVGGAGGTGYSGAGGGAGGGSSAGTDAVGNPGGNGTADGGGAGGTAPTGGGIGGVGGPDHGNGLAPVDGKGGGGGGSGAKTGANETGGAGTPGKCILTWEVGVVYSVTVEDGAIAYGVLPLSAEQDTINLDDRQGAGNIGTGTANFDIKSSHAVNGAQWSLSTDTNGNDQFVHKFSTSGDSTAWRTFNTNPDVYMDLGEGIAVNDTWYFDLWIGLPISSTDYLEKTITITVLAVDTSS